MGELAFCLVEELQILLGKLCPTRNLEPLQGTMCSCLEGPLRRKKASWLGREPSLLERGGKWEEENELGRAPCRDAPPFIAAGSPSWGGGRASL